MVYTGTMIEELFEAVEREERRIAVLSAECEELPECSASVIQLTDSQVWHGAA